MQLLIYVTIIVIIASCTPQISKNSKKVLHQANKSIRLLLQSEAYSSFNGSILVAKKGNIIIQQNYGYIDFNKTSQITNESRFNIGSAAKEIPAVALLELINEGRLDYNDPINKHLSYLSPWSKNITIKDLLFYTSGLPPMDFLTANSDENAVNEIIKMDSLLFEPGSNYLYSNWNNFLQAKIVESIVGADFQSYVKEKYFNPLKIDGAIYDSNPPRTIENITKSYDRVNGDDERHNPNYKNFELCFGPLYMSPADLLKWVEYVQVIYKEGGVGVNDFFTATTIQNVGPLGIIERNSEGVMLHKHGGQAYSAQTSIYKNYDNELTIIIMTNSGKAGELNALNDKILNKAVYTKKKIFVDEYR